MRTEVGELNEDFKQLELCLEHGFDVFDDDAHVSTLNDQQDSDGNFALNKIFL